MQTFISHMKQAPRPYVCLKNRYQWMIAILWVWDAGG